MIITAAHEQQEAKIATLFLSQKVESPIDLSGSVGSFIVSSFDDDSSIVDSSVVVGIGLVVLFGGQEGEFVGHFCGGFLVEGHDGVGVNEKGVGGVSSQLV